MVRLYRGHSFNESERGRRGFFNCPTSLFRRGKKRSYLYYADPAEYFDLCQASLSHSRRVALLHDYGL